MDDSYIKENYYKILSYYVSDGDDTMSMKGKFTLLDNSDGKGVQIKDYTPTKKMPTKKDFKKLDKTTIETYWAKVQKKEAVARLKEQPLYQFWKDIGDLNGLNIEDYA